MVDWEISQDDGDGLQSLGSSWRTMSMMIVKHAEHFLQEEQLEIQLANGSVKIPWLIMAVLSPVFKDYLSYIEESTLMEPLVLIPDLDVEDFQVFKKHLFNSGDQRCRNSGFKSTRNGHCSLTIFFSSIFFDEN